MSRYLVRRIISGIGVMAALLVIVFVLTNVIGDPIELQRNPEFTTDEQVEELRRRLGYDRPATERFVDYMTGVLRGDLGQSLVQGRPASEILLGRLPATALLAGSAFLIAMTLAIPLALLASRVAGSRVDHAITVLGTGLASLPSFWFAIALIWIFAVGLSWLPSGGYGGVRELILPAIALAALPLGHTTLILASALRSEFAQPYVAVARAKGLSERAIAWRHVLRNASLVLATQAGFLIVTLMNGAVLIETVFAWPGIGELALGAIQTRDLPLVMASVIYIGLIVTIVNIVIDVGYARLDPRIRFS